MIITNCLLQHYIKVIGDGNFKTPFCGCYSESMSLITIDQSRKVFVCPSLEVTKHICKAFIAINKTTGAFLSSMYFSIHLCLSLLLS